MYRIKLILILIIVGGLIAYIGDKIGMKVGKKRLTLWGLRPKYTSILITICTGVLIALMSLSLLLIVSQQFRQVLFDIEDLIQEKKELKQEVAKLAQQEQDLTNQVGNLTHNLSLFGREYFQSVTKKITYNRGEVLGTKVFSNFDSQVIVKADLQKLINQVKKKHNLAKINYNPRELEKAASQITKQPRTIVRLVAAHNSFQTKELTVSFDLYQDTKVYTKKAEILTFQIKNNNLEEVINNLLQELEQLGSKDGLLPDKQGRVIEYNVVKFNQLVNKLRKIKGEKQIIVLAEETIWRSDQLEDKIKFRVEELQ